MSRVVKLAVTRAPILESDTGSDTGGDTGSDTAGGTGTDTGGDTGNNTGGDTGTDTGSDTGTDTGSDTGITVGPAIFEDGAFGGAIAEPGSIFTFPSGSEPWAGWANTNTDMYPLSFSQDATLTFTAAVVDGGTADVRFRFEFNPYPDIDPAYDTEVLTVTGDTPTEYTIVIESQGANTFSSFLMYLDTQDVAVKSRMWCCRVWMLGLTRAPILALTQGPILARIPALQWVLRSSRMVPLKELLVSLALYSRSPQVHSPMRVGQTPTLTCIPCHSPRAILTFSSCGR